MKKIKVMYFTGHSVLETYFDTLADALREAQKLSIKYGRWARVLDGDMVIEFKKGIIQ